MKKEIIFLDVETTGVEDNDKIIQLACKQPSVDDFQFSGYFYPGKKISIEAMSICHITNEMVADKPQFNNSNAIYSYIKDSLESGKNILVAHNAAFDSRFLRNEGITTVHQICTMKVAHHHDKKAELSKHTLQYLRYYYNLDIPGEINPHDALSDVIVLEALYKFYIKQGYTAEGMLEISKKPIILKRIPFGKYKGLLFKDIPRDYLIWMRKQVDLEENLKATLDYNINNES